jgi:hypothetical protein
VKRRAEPYYSDRRCNPEHEQQVRFFKELAVTLHPAARRQYTFATTNQAVGEDPAKRRYHSAEGMCKGLPDVFCIWPNPRDGRIMIMENKSEGHSATPEQREFGQAAAEVGHHVFLDIVRWEDMFAIWAWHIGLTETLAIPEKSLR